MDQGEDGAEVASQPDRDRRDQLCERAGVGDRDPVLGGREPDLEVVPAGEVGLAEVVVGQTREHELRLVGRVGRREREQARLVLGMKRDRGRGDDQSGRPFALDEPRLELAVLALLDRLVADAPLREQAAHEVGGEVALQPGRLEEDEEAVAERLRSVGERPFAHRREQVVGLLREEVENSASHTEPLPGRPPGLPHSAYASRRPSRRVTSSSSLGEADTVMVLIMTFDEADQLVGIEVLGASRVHPTDALARGMARRLEPHPARVCGNVP